MHFPTQLRNSLFFKNRICRAVMMFLFPPVICMLAELGQTQDLSELWYFSLRRAGVVLFSCLFTAAVFWTASLLAKRAWIGAAAVSILYMTVSTVDFYKNQSNGSHFLFTDIQMLGSISGMGDFASLFFSPVLFLCWLGAAASVFLLWCADIRFRKRFGPRCITAGALAWLTAFTVCAPELFTPVCQLFGIDSTYTYNAFGEAERFENNNLISNFVVSINQQVESEVKEPDNYSDRIIETIIDEQEPEAAVPSEPDVLPNVIVIMSETFADFRALDSDPRLDEVYEAFDRILEGENTWTGQTVVPTFGGGTVKTEFELLFGLPVRSLNNAFIPHELLDDETAQTAFPKAYASLGYSTAYIHPYHAEFYGREDIYDSYGFDRMLFLEDLTVPFTEHNGYVDDASLYLQAEELMKKTDGPDFIHITTMQNHMPYGTEEDGDEYSAYLEGIRKSCVSLEGFLRRLEYSGEPFVLLFTGDHFPYFTEQGNIYQQTGMTVETCGVLYEQTCFIRSSGTLCEELPDGQISAFYLPHLVWRAAGLAEDAFIGAMLEEMGKTPVYSVTGDLAEDDLLLDILTYDRVLGEGYSSDEML